MSQKQSLRLRDLEVFYSERQTAAHRFGSVNALGFYLWPGVEGMAACFTLKTLLFFGPLRLHALRLAGFGSPRRRIELVGSPARPDGVIAYGWRCIRLLIWGVPLSRIGAPVRLLKDSPAVPGAERPRVGAFTLTRSDRTRR